MHTLCKMDTGYFPHLPLPEVKDKIHRAELSHYKVPSENLALSMFHCFSLHSHGVVIYFIKPIVYTGTKTTYCRYFLISFIKLK